MIVRLRDLARDEAGSALVEYALVIALISLVSYGVLVSIGDTLEQFFIDSSAGLGNVAKYPQ